jgi:ABC-type multidrug transport system permease subunit
MPIWTLTKKELRLLFRDRLAALILLGMPLVFIVLLGLLLGEGFGQDPDNRLRVTLLDLDRGYADQVPVREALAWLTLSPAPTAPGLPQQIAGVVGANLASQSLPTSWAQVVERDLTESNIRIEFLHDRAEALQLVRESKRPAVLVLGPDFSDRLSQCSFLSDGINPFFRDGVKLEALDAELLRDETQITAASIIEQVAQVTMLRVILPYMIGKAFERLSDPTFIELLGKEVRLPIPGLGKVPLSRLLTLPEHKEAVGSGVQKALSGLFSKYDLTGKTWAALTKSKPKDEPGAPATQFVDESGSGLLRRGAARYQILVPSLTVMFAFALVLTVGWVFVSERRQGTLKRLRAAPLTRAQVLLGKFIPCFAISLAQGVFLLVAGKLVFGMRWGPDEWSLGYQVLWLLPIVVSTSLAAMGLGLLIAVLSRTEIQVAIAGTLLVLVLGLVSFGRVLPGLVSDQIRELTLVTPNAWALDAYGQLFLSSDPNLGVVIRSCLILLAFGAGFISLGWWTLRLD